MSMDKKLEHLEALPALIGSLKAAGGAAISVAASAPKSAPPPPPIPRPQPAPPTVNESKSPPTSPAAQSPPVEAPPAAEVEPPAVDPAPVKKKPLDAESEADPELPADGQDAWAPVPLNRESALEIWRQAIADLGDKIVEQLADEASLAIPAPNQLAVTFSSKSTFCVKRLCEPDRFAQLEAALANRTGGAVRVSISEADDAPPPAEIERVDAPHGQPPRGVDVDEHPLVQRAVELFAAEVVHSDATPPPPQS